MGNTPLQMRKYVTDHAYVEMSAHDKVSVFELRTSPPTSSNARRFTTKHVWAETHRTLSNFSEQELAEFLPRLEARARDLARSPTAAPPDPEAPRS